MEFVRAEKLMQIVQAIVLPVGVEAAAEAGEAVHLHTARLLQFVPLRVEALEAREAVLLELYSVVRQHKGHHLHRTLHLKEVLHIVKTEMGRFIQCRELICKYMTQLELYIFTMHRRTLADMYFLQIWKLMEPTLTLRCQE